MRRARHLLTASMLALSTPPHARAGTEELAPPGDCTKQEHRELKQAVGEACKAQSMRCDESMDCNALLLNLQRFDACILARQKIMDRCYRGGNEAHREKRGEYLRGRERCRDFMLDKKCDSSTNCE